MAAATFKGVNMTILDADPRVPVEVGSQGGRMRISTDTLAVTTTMTDEVGDAWFLASIPSNAKVHSIKLWNDAAIDAHATPTLDFNVGIYNGGTKFTSAAGTTYAAFAAIDDDCYATAVTGSTAAGLGIVNSGLELAWEARDINAVHNYAWEDCGLTADPNVEFRIAVNVETAGAATHQNSDVTLQVWYTVD